MFNRRTAMLKAGKRASFSALLIVTLFLSLISPVGVKPVSADPGKLTWSIVDTPSSDRNVIVSPSEVNVVAIGSDDRAFNAVDIPNGKVYRSVDGGVSWTLELSANLIAAGAGLPVWNLAVAPDDASFLVAITADPTAVNTGPRKVFISQNGGARWDDTNFPSPAPLLGPNEFIGCVDVSVIYGGISRDIAIGTRDGLGGGRVFVMQAPGFSNWRNQNLTPSDVVALKFSPTYPSDSSLVVVYSSGTGTYANVGVHDTGVNTTDWTAIYGVTPPEVATGAPGSSPTHLQIITADLELPSDFSGSDSSLRRFYVSTDAVVGPQSGVYRVDNTVVFYIKPPTTAPTSGRISSIAYYGTYTEGILLAGEVEADPITGMVYVWRTSNPMVTIGPPTWLKPDTYKSPTGGAIATPAPVGYFANAQVAWSSDGTRAYCGTSSANPTFGGTAWVAGTWPFAWQTGVPFDESAFSVSPYSPNYEQLLALYNKSPDTVVGNIWNQLSLIDTQLSVAPLSSFFSDVAALEVPAAAGGEVLDYNILYLAAINPDPNGFDSIWRSTSDPLGRYWERILCTATSNNGILLRIKQTAYDEETRSQVIVFADTNTNTVGTSLNEGQVWHIQPLVGVTDLTLAADGVLYILNNTDVYRYKWATNSWLKTHEVHTDLNVGHTIAVPLKNPEGEAGKNEDWVIVGEAGPPGGMGMVVYADFSQVKVEFEPPIALRLEVPPIPGDAHAIADDKFEQNKTIYNAVRDTTGVSGKIYRWVIDESTSWDELEPPNNAFYGLVQRNDVLYGAWNVPTPPTNPPGVDRTLYPRVDVPPPPEWDDLTVGLPVPPAINFPVLFTREPSSLKVSSNEYNNLWAIDNKTYNRTSGIGCLWGYTDTAAKAGPWTTAPASGDLIPVDPVTGRAEEINFAWKQLSYSSTYELQLAKDRDFYIRLLVNEDITPADPLAPECFFPAGGLVPVQGSGIANFGNLESGHIYYWRVRARAAVTGEEVRSPWSATMYFTVGAGLPVMAQYPTVTLFSPLYGARAVSRSPAFSWSPMPKTTKYEFILAKDAALQQVIVKTNVPLTSYLYDGTLDYNTSYFWQVRVVEPIVSDPSAIGTFTVMAEKKPVEPAQEKPSPIPFWVWGVIAVCAVLVAAIIAYAVVGSGYAKPKVARVIKIEPVASRAPSPTMANMAKMWGAISTKVRGWRFLRKRGGTGSEDNPKSVE